MSGDQKSRGDWLAGNGSWATTHLVPLLLIVFSPPLAVLLWVIIVHHDGSVLAVLDSSPAQLLAQLPRPSWIAVAMLLGWLAFQLLLLRFARRPPETHDQ